MFEGGRRTPELVRKSRQQAATAAKENERKESQLSECTSGRQPAGIGVPLGGVSIGGGHFFQQCQGEGGASRVGYLGSADPSLGMGGGSGGSPVQGVQVSRQAKLPPCVKPTEGGFVNIPLNDEGAASVASPYGQQSPPVPAGMGGGASGGSPAKTVPKWAKLPSHLRGQQPPPPPPVGSKPLFEAPAGMGGAAQQRASFSPSSSRSPSPTGDSVDSGEGPVDSGLVASYVAQINAVKGNEKVFVSNLKVCKQNCSEEEFRAVLSAVLSRPFGQKESSVIDGYSWTLSELKNANDGDLFDFVIKDCKENPSLNAYVVFCQVIREVFADKPHLAACLIAARKSKEVDAPKMDLQALLNCQKHLLEPEDIEMFNKLFPEFSFRPCSCPPYATMATDYDTTAAGARPRPHSCPPGLLMYNQPR